MNQKEKINQLEKEIKMITEEMTLFRAMFRDLASIFKKWLN